MQELSRQRIVVEGLVQGVGFRPFVYREAARRGLRGRVRNEAAGVVIDVEGDAAELDAFARRLREHAPAPAAVSGIRLDRAPPGLLPPFEIDVSSTARGAALVGADVATCADCVRELFDPADRRYRYPFLSCTACGPRFTIQTAVPFDRERTSMRAFAQCDACMREYGDPSDRRFHAQTNACAACGPRLRACAADGTGRGEAGAALAAAVTVLAAGGIVAVKGLGGYHIACAADCAVAVRTLRARKQREAKPLALMVASAAAAAELCDVSDAEAALLSSAARPIVLLRRRADCALPHEIAGDTGRLGIMLPYTPLHHLLLHDAGRPVVLTSGNRSDQPIVTDDERALRELGGIADLFLTHDRAIVARTDDSVVHVQNGRPALVRRSRGFAPLPIRIPFAAPAPVLAVGGELKNTFCLVRGADAFVSQHVGDVAQADTHAALHDAIRHGCDLLGIEPIHIAHDLHPDYSTTRIAQQLADARGLRLTAVQHHHAHVAACMADNGVTGPVLGVVFDGTGYGADGAVWGGEFLLVDGARAQRVGHLGYVPLPGGDAAIRHPLRMAAAHMLAAAGHGSAGRGAAALKAEAPDATALDAIAARFSAADWRLLVAMIERGVHSPPTSSAGRLFDAVSALAGLCDRARYEGEAAMLLEAAADTAVTDGYEITLRDHADVAIADCGSVIRGVTEDLARGRPVGTVAARFHNALRDLIVALAVRTRAQTGITRVALTGGVFQNSLLTERATQSLRARGFDVITHHRVPCNDGGLSLGQAAVAALLMEG